MVLMEDAAVTGQCEPRRTGTGSRPWRWIGCLGVLLLASGACTANTLDLFDPDLGLLAHWALDENQAGSSVVDSSGFGSHGSPSANPPLPTQDVPPVHFSDPFSLSFNGLDQWIGLKNPPLLNTGGPISVAAWIRATKIDARSNVIAHGYRFDPNYDFALRIEAGSFVITTWDGIDHQAAVTIRGGDVGAWVHLCGVFDGTAYHLYRDGTLAATNPDAAGPQANVDATWTIGAHAPPDGAVDNQFQGQIDDVRIYGRALSQGEIEALYRR